MAEIRNEWEKPTTEAPTDINPHYITLLIQDPKRDNLSKGWNVSKSCKTFLFYVGENQLDPSTDEELQLKCIRMEDRIFKNCWPKDVQIVLNEQALPTNFVKMNLFKPLYIKRFCFPGRNSITFNTAEDDVFAVMYRAVLRVPIQDMLATIVNSQTLPIEVAKNHAMDLLPVMSNILCQGQPRLTAVRVSMICPCFGVRIKYPARLRNCPHLQCFDLEKYLQQDLEPDCWKCVICDFPASLEDIVVDTYFQEISNDCGEHYPLVSLIEPWISEEMHQRFLIHNKAMYPNLWFDPRSDDSAESTLYLKFEFANILSWRVDLEIELQILRHDCKMDHSVNPLIVHINNIVIPINWACADDRMYIDIKDIMQLGKNKLMIVKSKHCGHHTFKVHLVHRPSAKSISRRFMPQESPFPHEPKMESRRFAVNPIQMEDRAYGGIGGPAEYDVRRRYQVSYPAKWIGCSHYEGYDIVTVFQLRH